MLVGVAPTGGDGSSLPSSSSSCASLWALPTVSIASPSLSNASSQSVDLCSANLSAKHCKTELVGKCSAFRHRPASIRCSSRRSRSTWADLADDLLEISDILPDEIGGKIHGKRPTKQQEKHQSKKSSLTQWQEELEEQEGGVGDDEEEECFSQSRKLGSRRDKKLSMEREKLHRHHREKLHPKKNRLQNERDRLALLLQSQDINLPDGELLHSHIISHGLEEDTVLANLLVRMYRIFGCVDEARHAFDHMPVRTASSWNCMIGAYTKHGKNKDALLLFQEMQKQRVKPNKITYTCILGACMSPEALEDGKAIHASIVNSGLHCDVLIQNAIVNMYAKCGDLDIARSAFDDMGDRTVVSWNTLMDAYSKHGNGKQVVQVFREMQKAGIKPDNISYVCLLSACSHAGLAEEGQEFFDTMVQEHGITPTLKHYTCMIDLLGRAGQLKEAEDMMDMMPYEPDVHVWMSFLGAAKMHGDVMRAERAAEELYDLDSQHASPYVLLSNTYAANGMWDHVERVRQLMIDRGVIKPAGCSWIDVENGVHEFVANDRSHPMADAIYKELERLSTQMKEQGFTPDTKVVLHNVDDSIKEQMLCGHSEKLAIAFGLLSTPYGTTIRITKNLRVCPDCHSAAKFISKMLSREIVLRDANRFHHFRKGVCSCGDYW